MTKHEWNTQYTLLEKAFIASSRRMLTVVHNHAADAAQSEAFQLYQIIEELATLADTEPAGG